MMTVSMCTHAGTVRELNEDGVMWDAGLGFMGVADGMGGHNAGEVASRMALESALAFLQRTSENDELTWPCEIDPGISWNANRLIAAVKVANRFVFKASEQRATCAGMGTTLVAAIAGGDVLTFVSVGDSRIYAVADGTVRQLSRDDSWIELLAKQTGAALDDLKEHPMRNVLTRVIGGRADVDARPGEIALSANPTILLCTDGFHNAVPPELIVDVLGRVADLAQAAEELVRTAVTRDGRDNATVLLARYSARSITSGG
jgi:protein phosphatase